LQDFIQQMFAPEITENTTPRLQRNFSWLFEIVTQS